MIDLLALGSRATFVCGKGGVGKTTTAAALAVVLADAGRETLVLSLDPAHSLGDALDAALGPDPTPVPGVAHLQALEIDPRVEQSRFLGSERGALLELLERGTYLDGADVEGFVDLTLPGADELAALFRLVELLRDPALYLVVDTAPTGHTLRLLDLPGAARGWLGALEAMEEKHRAVSLALAGAYLPGEPYRLLARLRADLDELEAALRDPERTRFLLVTNPEPVVLAETRRYQAALAERGIAIAGVLVNRAVGAGDPGDPSLGAAAYLPRLGFDPRGAEALRRFAAAASPAPPGTTAERPGSSAGLRVGGRFEAPMDRSLYIVGGKGGVGKSTTAGALALLLAERGDRKVLLLSTDPAGSLGEVLGTAVDSTPRSVPGTGLSASQLDAEAVWSDFRREYHAEAEQLFTGIVAGGIGGDADQRVVERLIDFAPPGVDELMAMLQVIDLTEDHPYDAIVLDSAPTGHLVRLLELPGVALDWVHAILRVLLKYREVLGLGALAERLVELSKQLRGLGEHLRDPRYTWFLAVALPESLSVPETRRLFAHLAALEIVPGALLVNRLLDGDDLAPELAAEAAALAAAVPGAPLAAAPRLDAGPVGPDALLDLARRWRLMERN